MIGLVIKLTGKFVTNLVLISIIFLFNACTRYNVTWRNYSRYDDTKIVLFSQKNEKVSLYLNKTISFRTFFPIEYLNLQQPSDCYLYIYPFLGHSTKSEIFFYDISILEQDRNRVIIEERQNVEAYYADFYINDLCYTVISQDNELIISIPQDLKNIDDILNNHDVIDYTYLHEGKTNYHGVVVCGYIVKSDKDNSYHWLRPGI
jgi:hypothetical protein